MKEKKTEKKERILLIIKQLMKDFPDPEGVLDYTNPLECLVATILSAQCTDVRVNIVTPALFERYQSAADFAKADQTELEQMVRSTGFFRNKSTNIIKCCKSILSKHDGKVPETMDELVALEGVGRKTANCVLGNAYGQPAVMVDTHVKRLSWRMGLTNNTNPDKIEFDIKELMPEELWMPTSHSLIFHGRNVCKSRKPNCPICSIKNLCPKIDVKNRM
ncbi:endonuclease III [bacterium]|nr:endonuclease III [bacterium]